MAEKVKAEYVLADELTEKLKKTGKSDPNLLHFSSQLLSGCAKDILEELDEAVLLNQVVDAFNYIQKRPLNLHKIRAYDIEKKASVSTYENTSSVIEIINDDMPFLVDSIIGELQEQGVSVQNILHPVLQCKRDKSGELGTLIEKATIEKNEEKTEDVYQESFIQIQIEHISDQRKKDLIKSLSDILQQVRMAVADWRLMLVRLTQAVADYTEIPPPIEAMELTESVQFMKWLTDSHFTFLGMREYELVGGDAEGELKPKQETSLGILRDPKLSVLRGEEKQLHLSESVRSFFFSPAPIIIAKANTRSKVHRHVHLDYIGIKIYNKSGHISGELKVVGLFTSTAYTRPPSTIPFLRSKVESVISQYGKSRNSHGTKALQNVLDTFPRDELFQISVEDLYNTAVGIHSLDITPGVKAFVRMDKFNRYASVLVYVPRDDFSTDVRISIGELLADTFVGRVSAFYPFFPEGSLVRIHYIIGLSEQDSVEYDLDEIENSIEKILKGWSDDLRDSLSIEFLASKAGNLYHKYKKAFPAGYQEGISPNRAIQDITRIEGLTKEEPTAIDFYHETGVEADSIRVSIYNLGEPIPLSKRVPIFENFGFFVIDESSYKVTPQADDTDNSGVYLHIMKLKSGDGSPIDLENNCTILESAFLAVWKGLIENDLYNKLLLKLNVSWHEVEVIRALGAYLKQIRVPFSKRYLAETLVKHPEISSNLIEIFKLRCDPDLPLSNEARRNSQKNLSLQVEEGLSAIPNLDEDRVLRHFKELLGAILRTNFYQRDFEQMEVSPIAFKFKSSEIEAVPEPKPHAEIFVYSERFQGVHLRGGEIARGGLRWSDRPQDFRTEILGLAKAQQVKNTVIVPSGAKGGFVPKKLEGLETREEKSAEAVTCYKSFISSLLSLTDNLKGEEVLAPKQVIRHDGDDPYLVVAADKGTATFSDYANAISQKYEFWLDDAFASGGSAGYDHKKMGITARGGWESVKRHFREKDVDIQSEPFTVIGIGDMSGDVFGNGMLLSKTIQLVAAFDHRDIFIDPKPTTERSWLERKRLFEMPRSSWQDYNHELISQGGGIFSRSAKSIELTDQIREMTGLDQETATPNELIRSILKVEADLLWFGGIGTYICDHNEREEEIGDRANDAIRVKASEVNVKVVGEGANLGMTQKARIAFAKQGGCVNSDAIDNSAGVNSSDLEVNIKIALGDEVKSGVMSLKDRDKLLTKMTEEVASACLRNNYMQSLTISLGQVRRQLDLSLQRKLISTLEKSGLLDRTIENLPSETELVEREQNGESLTRPELSVLLAYAKIDLFDKLIESSILDDEFLNSELLAYFPKTLVEKIPQSISKHHLKRQIIATQLSNAIINRGGSTMIVRIEEETGRDVEAIAYAFVAARAIFGLEETYAEIDALDNKISGQQQLQLYIKIQDLLRKLTSWFLKNVDLSKDLTNIIKTYRSGLEELDKTLLDYLKEEKVDGLKQKCSDLETQSIPADFASYISSLEILEDGPDIILASQKANVEVPISAMIYHEVGDFFDLFEMRKRASEITADDYYDRIAVNSALSDISFVHRKITQKICSSSEAEASDKLKKWIEENKNTVERVQQVMKEIIHGDVFSVAKLTVAVSHLRELC